MGTKGPGIYSNHPFSHLTREGLPLISCIHSSILCRIHVIHSHIFFLPLLLDFFHYILRHFKSINNSFIHTKTVYKWYFYCQYILVLTANLIDVNVEICEQKTFFDTKKEVKESNELLGKIPESIHPTDLNQNQ